MHHSTLWDWNTPDGLSWCINAALASHWPGLHSCIITTKGQRTLKQYSIDKGLIWRGREGGSRADKAMNNWVDMMFDLMTPTDKGAVPTRCDADWRGVRHWYWRLVVDVFYLQKAPTYLNPLKTACCRTETSIVIVHQIMVSNSPWWIAGTRFNVDTSIP